MTLKAAVAWSTFAHLGLFIARPPLEWMPPRAAVRSLEVSYLPVPPERAAAPRRVVPLPIAAAAAQGRVAVAPPAPAAARQPVKVARASAGDLPVLPPTSGPPEPVVSDAPRPAPRSPSPAAVLPDWEFSALQHKEQIRKHLKARLHYPGLSLEGTVRLRLVLTAEGSLQTVQVLEPSDPRLVEPALQDVQSAAPYPRFLPAMRRRTVSYEFLVRYQPD